MESFTKERIARGLLSIGAVFLRPQEPHLLRQPPNTHRTECAG